MTRPIPMPSERVEDLFDHAIRFADHARQASLQDAMKYVTRTEALALATAQINATATIFAALVEADLAEQIRTARENIDARA